VSACRVRGSIGADELGDLSPMARCVEVRVARAGSNSARIHDSY